MVFQAFLDESIDAETFVIAGYIATPKAWLAFSAEWQEMLQYRGSWSALKMSWVASQGGDESWEKTEFLYRIIEKHVALGFSVVVDRKAVAAAAKEFGLPDFMQNPYMPGSRAAVVLAAESMIVADLDGPLNLIFDERSEQDVILEGWKAFKLNAPPSLLPHIADPPRFEKDEDFPPLQAADLYAWWVRKWWNENREFGTRLEFPWQTKRDIYRASNYLLADEIRLDYLKLQRALMQLPRIAWG